MKSHTEKHKVKLNPCKYCGETEVEIIYYSMMDMNLHALIRMMYTMVNGILNSMD